MIRSVVLVATGLVWAVFYLTPPAPRQQPPPADPQPMTPTDLVHAVAAGRRVGEVVRVPFARPLAPTADPRTFEYRPGTTGLLPALVVVEFAEVPAGGPAGGVVVGTVEGFRFDPRTGRRAVWVTSASAVQPR